MRLLLIEDSERFRTNLTKVLSRLGHAVDAVPNGEDGEISARLNNYDAILLDLMLPGQDGLTLLEKWRKSGNATPVLLLTALGEVEDRVKGLTLGADDYLVKPFAVEELSARLEAVVRRSRGKADSLIVIEDLEINLAARDVRRGGVSIGLTAREFGLLELLARRPGHVFTREQIELHLYAEADAPLSNAVDTAIYSLRRKLGTENQTPLIHTRRGLGYVFGLP